MHFLSGLTDAQLRQPLTLDAAYEPIRILCEQIRTCSPVRDKAVPGIVGQDKLINSIIIALISGGHCLLEGNPGVAKTLASKTTGEMAGLRYKRIQFMPDTMPSDLILKELLTYENNQPKIITVLGPVFANIVLADEINRASPKAQAALLEATGERHVSFLNRPRRVIRPDDPDEPNLLREHGPFFGVPVRYDPASTNGQVFMVIATQNPIETEGVFPPSKAQEDRFMFKLVVVYPEMKDFAAIERHAFEEDGPPPRVATSPEDHVKTLYFFCQLRALLLGRAAAERWDGEPNKPVAEKARCLINFSHLHYLPDRGDRDFRPVPDGARQKQNELQFILKDWSKHPTLRKRTSVLNELLTRGGQTFPEVLSGADPRGSLQLVRAAHAHAFLHGRIHNGLARPTWEDDFCPVAHDLLRHRIRLTPGAEAMGARSETVVDVLLEWIKQW